jgi:SAM-dependent methyltransferase
LDNKSHLEELLNVYWLRPETALWRSIDIAVMDGFCFQTPSLDLGCGDGIFSFIRAGGCFDITFDAFQSMTDMRRFFDKVDVYDSHDPSVRPIIIKSPIYRIDYAFDHKINLLEKAKSLNFYTHYVNGDANNTLPFEDNYFQSIFSNIAYWLINPEFAIQEIYRVLKQGGECCLMLPNRSLIEYSFYYNYFMKTQDPRYKYLDLLDRGRVTDNIKNVKNSEEWINIINKAGFDIIQHKKHLSKTTIQIWDIGLRPLFPLLHKMVLSIQKEQLIEIKKEWIDTVKSFLEPMLNMDCDMCLQHEPAFNCFIIEKR